ncbi:MAG: hypothetical protein IPN61_06560 [Bacteroidetes bacterium]|nr:hypothetical protein [Bacteroidota bacterium]
MLFDDCAFDESITCVFTSSAISSFGLFSEAAEATSSEVIFSFTKSGTVSFEVIVSSVSAFTVCSVSDFVDSIDDFFSAIEFSGAVVFAGVSVFLSSATCSCVLIFRAPFALSMLSALSFAAT